VAGKKGSSRKPNKRGAELSGRKSDRDDQHQSVEVADCRDDRKQGNRGEAKP
jgi:hypothetical protein